MNSAVGTGRRKKTWKYGTWEVFSQISGKVAAVGEWLETRAATHEFVHGRRRS